MSVALQIANRDFGKRAIVKLAKAGIRIINIQAIPDMSSSMPYANADRGYVVDDNGTGRVWTYFEVKARLA
jgi:hypothetical protein